MKRILVIGSTGQIGSELTRELRARYGNQNVIAGYITGAEPTGELKEGGPSAIADVTDGAGITEIVKQYNIDTIYNLAALLSVVAESKPRLAWKIGIDGLWNVLEVARLCSIYTQFDRLVRPRHPTPDDTARHHSATCNNLRRIESYDRVAERLLSKEVRR